MNCFARTIATVDCDELAGQVDEMGRQLLCG
jgi:hypothetical protein